MSNQVYLMMSGFMDENRAKEYVSRHPEAKQEIELNLKKYGVPFLSGTIGWMKRCEVGKTIDEMLNDRMKSQLVELLVYARDGLGEEYAIQYDVLRCDEHECFEKAVAYEERIRRKKGGNDEGKQG
jgi:hypothetical protein